jgi:hypothetical protein
VALARLGALPQASDSAARMGKVFEPVPAHGRVYEAERERQHHLYAHLFEEKGNG